MIYRLQAIVLARMQQAAARPDRGLETLEYVAWAAGIVVVIGGLIGAVKFALDTFWNGIDFASILPK